MRFLIFFVLFLQNQGQAVIVLQNPPLDHEAQKQYVLTLTATDAGIDPGTLSSSASVTINILDVNDVTPTFMMPIYVKTVSEDHAVGTSVLQVMATDNEMGDNGMIMYKILMGDGTFSIDMVR